MVALFILASGCEVYSSLFSFSCLYLGGNKFSKKFASKMFKPTSSSISSIVGALWTVNFLHFLCFDVKFKAKNSITCPEKKFRARILPWPQFNLSKNFSFNQRTICTLSVYFLQQNVSIAIKN